MPIALAQTVQLLRAERRARLFFVVLGQSSLGTGAAYVGLLLIAYDRFHSPWALSIVLCADLLPAMVLGPILGAVADRWSRRGCLVVADAARAIAFAGIAVVPSFEATVALALAAGVGTALFTPAALAGLPSLVEERRLPAATSIYSAVADLGLMVGPALAALILLTGGPETIMVLNAATFAISAAVLARLDFGAAPAAASEVPATGRWRLIADAREGLVASRRIPGLAIVLGSATAAICVGGLINVAEVPFVTEELDGSDSAYSLLVALAGLGFIAGSLSGSSGGDRERKKRRYVAGLLLIGAGYLLAASSPVLIPALAAFMVAGFGNGLTLVYERQIVQEVVPDSLLGRVFGVRDALTAWAFAVAFLGSGVVLTLTGTREVILASGIGGLVTAAVIAFLFARHDAFSQVAPAEPTVEPRLGGSPETLGHGRVG